MFAAVCKDFASVYWVWPWYLLAVSCHMNYCDNLYCLMLLFWWCDWTFHLLLLPPGFFSLFLLFLLFHLFLYLFYVLVSCSSYSLHLLTTLVYCYLNPLHQFFVFFIFFCWFLYSLIFSLILCARLNCQFCVSFQAHFELSYVSYRIILDHKTFGVFIRTRVSETPAFNRDPMFIRTVASSLLHLLLTFGPR